MSFRLGGCRVRVQVSFFAAAAFACLFLPEAPGLLLAVALHEGAHILMMKKMGAAPREMQVSGMGLRLVLPERAPTGWRGALVSLAGPLSNLLAYGLGLGPANLGLGLLHLLPIEPLDGGLALRHLAGARASRIASAVCLLPLATLGFWVLLRTRYNFSLLFLSMYLMAYLLLGKDWG